MKEFKYYIDNGIFVVNKPPPDYPFLGGKQDDITVTVAQVFKDQGPDDPRRTLAESDQYFTHARVKYDSDVPVNKYDSFYRARFTERGELNLGHEALVSSEKKE